MDFIDLSHGEDFSWSADNLPVDLLEFTVRTLVPLLWELSP
jgi:hypothetical protein